MKTRIRGIAKGLAVGTGSLALALSLAACGGSSSDDASGDDGGGKVKAGESTDSDSSSDEDSSAADDTSSDEASDDSSSDDAASDDSSSDEDSAASDESSDDASDDSADDDSSSDDSSGGSVSKADEKEAEKNFRSFYAAMAEEDFDKACSYVKMDSSLGLTESSCPTMLEGAKSSYSKDAQKQLEKTKLKTKSKGDDQVAITSEAGGDFTLVMSRDDSGKFVVDLGATG